MSTRYVWEKHTLKYVSSKSTVTSYEFTPPSGSNDAGQLAGYLGETTLFNEDTGKYSLKNVFSKNLVIGKEQQLYFGASGFAPSKENAEFAVNSSHTPTRFFMASSYGRNILFQCFPQNSNTGGIDTSANPLEFNLFTVTGFKTSSSTKIENVSSNKSTSYPNTSGGGLQGGYVYIYKGSDNIDPTAISYETEDLKPGNSVSVSITARSNTYGGTISYLYQCSLNGGGWTDIKTTTATSINFTVPASAKSIRFRVRAQDNMGFTSTTYVTGPTAGVERLQAWVGVSGKARKGVELYVGVNGKARKVVAAYIGVDGKARRFL